MGRKPTRLRSKGVLQHYSMYKLRIKCMWESELQKQCNSMCNCMFCQESRSQKREKKSGGKDQGEGNKDQKKGESNGGACHSHPEQVKP